MYYLLTSAQYPQIQTIEVKKLLECLVQLTTPDSELYTLVPPLQQLQISEEDNYQQLVLQNMTVMDQELTDNTLSTIKQVGW